MRNLSNDFNQRKPICPPQNERRDFLERLKNDMEHQPPALQPRPLPPDIRHEFEAQLAQDLSDVCVYESPAVANLCQGMGAQACAQGNDIFFLPGKYQPYCLEGKAQIMDELVHIVQRKKHASEFLADMATEKAKKEAATEEAEKAKTAELGGKATADGIGQKIGGAVNQQGAAKQPPLGVAQRAGETRQIKRYDRAGEPQVKNDMIAAVSQKVRTAVRDWAKTGKRFGSSNNN